ncbi:MAG TPA: UDP-4-amino-4,6-dideoxy-N-acetyl-beta-L-altrosamine transaminase [Burkholderiales bacterium]|nr:UDP-4-amino-4,6-dideoxy-N-acetyl-beta-L-altrosamine transaminase [Burkholderiales bacterium]
MPVIPYARQSISQADVEAVVEVLRSDWLTQGPCIERFESEVAAYCGARQAVAVSNGTAALHLACMALGLGPGDRLWTSPNTFVASANCARYCGASVDFVDIDPRTGNLSVERLAEKLVDAEKKGTLPKVVVPVHFAGQPCDMEAIGGLARRYGFRVVEDASHAIGAEHRGEKTGSCAHSDITVLSFHPVKIVTTAEGGMTLTNDEQLAQRLRLLRTHGITRNAAEMRGASEGPWYYQQVALGYNYRLTDLQAALGSSQLKRIGAFLARRRALVERYHQKLAGLPLTLPHEAPGAASAWHLYVVQVDDPARRESVFRRMREKGVLVNVHYIPVHLQPYYRDLGFKPGDFPEAERYYQRAISLPLYFELTEAQQDAVCEALRESLDG